MTCQTARVLPITLGMALAGASPAGAEPRFEASGFVGIDYFGEDIQLGNSWASEQVPGTSAVVGARVAYLAVPDLGRIGRVRFQLAGEGEVAIAPAFTGGSFDGGGRMSYFAPVFGWRAHAMLRLAGIAMLRPHLVLGAGGATVASTSPFMTKETDPVAYWGAGASVPVSDRWHLRVDLRHGIMPGREGATSTVEVQLGLGASFGLPRKRNPRAEPPTPPPTQPVTDHEDSDGDGFPDWLDECPEAVETINGVADDDGCPEPDVDGDGMLGDVDRCPAQPEDFDRFEDEDGCPEPDNDSDGVRDGRDACPSVPETRNGIDDEDGCPDQVPPAVLAAVATAAKLTFEPGRARVTVAAKRLLLPLVGVLAERELRIAIVAHPDRKDGVDLARRRADAIKWYLVDQGVVADRLTIEVGGVKRSPIEIALVPLPAPTD